MNRFPEVSLHDAVAFVVDNRGKTVPVQDTGIPLISTACISNDSLYPGLKTERYVSDDIYQSWFRSHPEPGDIILTNKGSKNGEVSFVPNPVGFCIAQDMVALRANSHLVSPPYLFAALRSKLVQGRIKALNVDSVIPHFKKTDFDKLFIPLPPKREQDFIGSVYLEISKKIELNKKTNGTLEGIAKALFKSWFVDFDPVRAKAEGRPTGLPDEVSELFPDSFEESELGEIPSGWKVRSLGELMTLDSGLPYKGALKGTGDAFLLTMGCADKNLRFKSDGVHRYPSDIKEKHLVKPGEMVICSHDLTQARDQLGQPFVVPGFYNGKVTAAATNTFIVREKSHGSSDFLYQLFRSNGFREQMIASAKGSVILHISKDAALSYEFPYPRSFDLITAYQIAVESFSKKIDLVALENKSLSDIRDALLPRLISGELRVPDAEKMLEEAGV